MWIHTVVIELLKHFSGRENQTTFAAIGALMVNGTRVISVAMLSSMSTRFCFGFNLTQ